MRSSGGTNFAPPVSVVARTKATMDCLAAPSFHDGNGSAAFSAAARLAQTARMATAKTTRLNVRRKIAGFVFMADF